MNKVTTKKKKSTITSVTKHIRRHVKLAVVPHKANQYRPHAVRRYSIAGIVLLVFLVQGVYNSVTSGRVLGVESTITASGLLAATNTAREAEGKPALILNTALSRAAQLKAEDMLTHQYWSHTSPSGVTPWDWFGKVGYSYSEAGENLAKNFTTSDAVIGAWLQSPTHRDNMLKGVFTDVGFTVATGILDGRTTSVVVALYGTPAEQAVRGVTEESGITGQPLSFVARLGLGLQSLTPVAVGSIAILLVGANIALIAHFYRKKLPARLRRSWYKHHGIYKAVGFTTLALILLVAYGSGGQL